MQRISFSQEKIAEESLPPPWGNAHIKLIRETIRSDPKTIKKIKTRNTDQLWNLSSLGIIQQIPSNSSHPSILSGYWSISIRWYPSNDYQAHGNPFRAAVCLNAFFHFNRKPDPQPADFAWFPFLASLSFLLSLPLDSLQSCTPKSRFIRLQSYRRKLSVRSC